MDRGEGCGMKVITFEQFAAERGYGRNAMGDAGLHMTRASISPKVWRKKIDAQAARDAAWGEARAALRVEYDRLLAEGALRQPTRRETLEATAEGHPDRADVQAARRILARERERGDGQPT